MKIYKLEMKIKRGWRDEPTATSLHISREVAKSFAEKQLKIGFQHTYLNYLDKVVTDTFPYYPTYFITELLVNEGEYNNENNA